MSLCLRHRCSRLTTGRPASSTVRAGGLLGSLGSPYRWLSRQRRLTAALGRLTVGFRLQGSSYNRAGQSTTVTVQVIVEDEGLRQWRQDHQSVVHRTNAEVVRDELVNLVPSAATVELYGQLRLHAPQILSLPDLADLLRAEVLPALQCLGTPAEAVRGLPQRWWLAPHGLVEWAVSRGDPDSARHMVTRYLSLRPGCVQAFRRGLATPDQAPGPLYEPDVALGRLAATMGWINLSEHIAVSAPARRRTLLQRLRGDR